MDLEQLNSYEKDITSLETSLKTPFRIRTIISNIIKIPFLKDEKKKEQFLNLSEKFADSIIEKYSETKKINDIEKISIVDNFLIMFTIQWNVVYDIWWETPLLSNLDYSSIVEKREKENQESTKKAEKLEKWLDAIDSIFQKKKNEWFWNISEQDRLSTWEFWEEFNGKNPLEIQKILELLLQDLEKRTKLNPKLINMINKSRERYFQFIMWIGNTYERWAVLFKKSPESLWNSIKSILSSKSPKECLEFMYQIHKEMYENTYQSSQVKQSYKSVVKELHAQVFSKLKGPNISDEILLEFAKIVSGRWWKVLYKNIWRTRKKEQENYISSEFLDPNISNQVIILVFTRSGGIMERMDESKKFKIEDKKIGEKDPRSIVSDWKEVIKKYIRIHWKEEDPDKYLASIGCESILNLPDSTPYGKLKIEQQIALSLIVRFTEKIKQKIFPKSTPTYDALWNYMWEEHPVWEKFVEAQSILLEVREEAFGVVTNAIWKETSSGILWRTTKSAKELWFTWKDADIYNLFQEIQWNWLFSISDSWKNFSKDAFKTVGCFAVILWTAAAAWILVAPATVVWWIVVGVSASLASIWTDIIIQWKWFETSEEFIADTGSDLVVWWVTWALWWKLLHNSMNMVFKTKLSNGFVFGTEIVWLWIIPEMARQKTIDHIYREESVFN